MIINHNINAMNANRMVTVNSNNASKAMSKLSSGLRINSAADDAAGLAISEKMKGQISGLNQASSNAQNGVSLAQTADGALTETTSVLQRMRELSVQSANDTNTTSDRSNIQKEVDQLANQITNISNTTQFNTQNLLNGAITDKGTGVENFQIGANSGQSMSISIGAMDAKTLGVSRDATTGTIGAKNTAVASSVEADTGIDKKLATGNYNVAVSDVAASASAAQTTGSSALVTTDAVTGAATANTSVALTYSTTAAGATAGASVGATSYADISAFNTALGDCSAAGDSKTLTLTVDGTDKTITFAGDYSGADAYTDWNDAKTDVDTQLGGVATVAGADTKGLTFTSATKGATSKVAVKTDADTIMGVAVATDGDAAKSIGWNATGDLSGLVSGSANTVNGLNIDTTKITGTAVDNDVVTVTGTVASTTAQLTDNAAIPKTIGDAVTIDKANGGTYNVGNSTTGELAVTFLSGAAKTGTTGVAIADSASAATTFTNGQKQVDAVSTGGIDVSTQKSASLAITKVSAAIQTVSAQRAVIGAYQNRLESTINNLGTASQNLSSAQSSIADVDMAATMAEFSKNNIESQAAQAMISQANQQPSQVLQLLR